MMTCSTKKNDLALFDLKGTMLLTRLDTVQMTTYYANISPCGKFVAACGFTPDVKVWSVKFSKSGGFEKVSKDREAFRTLVESLVQMTTFDFTNFLEIGPFIYYNFSKNSSNQGVVE